VRLSKQRQAIVDCMAGSPGVWFTIPELVAKLKERGISCVETGASGCVRDLRKARFGGMQVDRKCLKPGHFAFRIWAR
jgi:hypothetical protein